MTLRLRQSGKNCPLKSPCSFPPWAGAVLSPGATAQLGQVPADDCWWKPFPGEAARCYQATYFLALSLIVKGHPRGSTSKAAGLLLAAGRQPYLQWMKSSPICSATAMLFTTTVSLALSTGHFSARQGREQRKAESARIEVHFQDRLSGDFTSFASLGRAGRVPSRWQ